MGDGPAVAAAFQPGLFDMLADIHVIFNAQWRHSAYRRMAQGMALA